MSNETKAEGLTLKAKLKVAKDLATFSHDDLQDILLLQEDQRVLNAAQRPSKTQAAPGPKLTKEGKPRKKPGRKKKKTEDQQQEEDEKAAAVEQEVAESEDDDIDAALSDL